MSSLHIGYFLEKVYLIDTQLGGTAKKNANKGDDFTGYKDTICQKLHQLKTKGEQKVAFMQKERTTDGIRLDVEIKDLITETEGILTKMNEALRKQSKDTKKYTQQNIEAKQNVYRDLRQQFYNVQQLIDPNSGITNQSVETLSDMKQKLMGDDNIKRPAYKEASKEEKDAMERWKQNDQIMDGKLDQIVMGTDMWVQNAKKIGEQIDHTMVQIDKLDKEVDITNAELTKQNNQLKAIVQKYREPNKFCLDIVLVCVFLGLCAVIYTMMK